MMNNPLGEYAHCLTCGCENGEQALHRTLSVCPVRVRRSFPDFVSQIQRVLSQEHERMDSSEGENTQHVTFNMRHAFPSCTYPVSVSLKSHDGIIISFPLPQSHCIVIRCRENERGLRRKTTAHHLHEYHSTVTSFIPRQNVPSMFSHIFLV